MPDNNNQSDIRVSMLERDVAQSTVVFAKLETTIDKLVDVSTSLKQIIAIHEIKLELAEATKKEIANELVEINKRIESLQEFRLYASGAIALGVFIIPLIYKFLIK